MASGTESCWRCGVQWAQEDEPPTTLRLVTGGAANRSRSDFERRIDEGGAFGSDLAVARRAAVRR
jgi:hypothetical protein